MSGFYVNDNFIRLQSYDNNLINAISGVTNTFPYVTSSLDGYALYHDPRVAGKECDGMIRLSSLKRKA